MKISRSYITNGKQIELNEIMHFFEGESYEFEFAIHFTDKNLLKKITPNLKPKMTVLDKTFDLELDLYGDTVCVRCNDFMLDTEGNHPVTLVLSKDITLPTFYLNVVENMSETDQLKNLRITVSKEVSKE